MSRAGASRPFLFSLLILGSIVGSAGIHAAEMPVLEGTVRDSLGNVLAGVEVLFVEIPAAGFAPAATALSGREGKFRVERLLPGLYRVAALKQGYRTFVGQINTVVQESVELVLQPTVQLDAEQLPRDPAWALRLPRRGMLHEVEGGPTVAGRPEPAAAPATYRDDLSVELEQLFSLSAGAAERRPEETDITPSKTRLALASSLGERGNIRVRGHQERLGASGSQAALGTSASQRAAALSLDMGYDAGDEGRLALTAHFNQTDYELASRTVAAQPLLQQEQQTWGYDASWSKQIDSDSRFAVTLGYVDASVAGPPSSGGAPAQAVGSSATVSNRAVGAEGSYVAVMSDRHDVQVALRAQLLRSPVSPYVGDPLAPATADGSSWTLQADAQDTWSLSSPFSLVYGLGYKQALVAREATLVVPRLGGSVATGGWYARAIVSYHAVRGAGDSGASLDLPPFRPARRFGYEAEVEVPLAEQIRLRGDSRYTPIQFDYFGYLHGAAAGDEHPLYLTDGNAAVEEHRLTLSEQRGNSQTYLELSDGRAGGTVAPLMPFDGPVPIRDGRELHYRNGRFGVVFPHSGTDLRVEYRRMRTETEQGRGGPGARQESVELRVRQDVARRQLPGDWRLLVALRLGTVQSADLDQRSEGEASETASALNRRISAGMSVLF